MSTPAFQQERRPQELQGQDQGVWPVGTDSFFQPRRAAFWVLAGLILNGLFYTGHMFSLGVRVVPVTAFLGLLAWGLYTLLFCLAFRTLDLLEQHPPEGYVLAFAWGGLGAVYFAAPANIAIQSLCAKLVSPEFVAVWGPAIAGPSGHGLPDRRLGPRARRGRRARRAQAGRAARRSAGAGLRGIAMAQLGDTRAPANCCAARPAVSARTRSWRVPAAWSPRPKWRWRCATWAARRARWRRGRDTLEAHADRPTPCRRG
jgi:hypothetical protein